MSVDLESLFVIRKDIKYKFNKIQCINHDKKKPGYCKIVVDKDDSKKTLIHDVNFNYLVKNYMVYCSSRESTKYKILNTSTKLILNDESKAYITVDGKRIFKIKAGYITMALLIELNEKTISYNFKLIGIYLLFIPYLCILYMLFIYYLHIIYNLSIIGKWHSLLTSNYTSRLRTKLLHKPIKPKEHFVKKFIKKQVPSKEHLKFIYYYLWLYVWLPSKGILFLH